MLHFRIAAIAILVLAAGITSAEAKVRLKPATCPVKADVTFKISGARGERDGVAAEYDWVAANRPGWLVTGQALIEGHGRPYDLLMLKKGRKTQTICFDISGFFGKGL